MTLTAGAGAVALDLEATCLDQRQFEGRSNEQIHGAVSLLQLMAEGGPVYIVDVMTLAALPEVGSPAAVGAALAPLLCDQCWTFVRTSNTVCDGGPLKLLFDVRKDSEALQRQLRVAIRGVLDLQLSAGGLWDERPLSAEMLSYAAQDVRHLHALRAHFAEHEAAAMELSSRYCGAWTAEPPHFAVDSDAWSVNEQWLTELAGVPAGIDGRVLAPGDAVQFLLQRAGGAEWSDAVVAAVGAAWCEVRITRTATTRRVAFDGSPLKLRLAPA
eukprot:gene39445-30894_t